MDSGDPFLPLWRRSFGDLALIAHQLRVALPHRWVRFHSLPDAKRYPENESEWATVLARWNQVLAAVLGEREGWLVAVMDAQSEWLTSRFGHGTSIPTGRITTPEERDPWDMRFWLHLHESGSVDPWLRRLASWDTVNTLFVDAECLRVVAPYDGGIDVILATEGERDLLRDRFSPWLSDSPNGL